MLGKQRAARVDFAGKITSFEPAQDSGLKAAETEVERVAFHLRQCEPNGMWIAVRRELVDHGSARVTETEEFRDFVESLACGVVTSFSKEAVDEILGDFVEMRVAAAHDEREGGELDRVLRSNRMNVPFDVIHRDERERVDQRERFRVGHSNEQRADESGSLGDGDRGKIFEASGRFGERGTDDGYDCAQVFARSEFGYYTAVSRMRRHLRGDDRRENARAVFDNGGGGFVAGGFDAEDTH